MDIGRGLFDAWFDFGRPTAAPHRNAAGAIVVAPVDAPRFDHDLAGKPTGLLVEPGAALGQADRARLQIDAIGATVATVLHALREDDGSISRRAWYSRDPQVTIDACLGQAGRHISIAAIPGYRPNAGGFVRYRGVDWQLAGVLDGGVGTAIGDGSGRALIEG
ncbi:MULTISPECIES: hypothetical protein [unclassified Sphingopyxis]|uniref:hypothetical protein n=1 Tax=unclassified Sphingopyxis TaxID=2614943 RepID=UPI000730A79E|nr:MULTISPECIES: hypothetical protein [unclassified Sphingopyxis]KTE24452.1 hypothetical protein ATE61_13680 [Sphingopyxis sp. H057]KTE50980.1 hypothetical protein ATE69_17380 [Sphingopyxis sp. H071]KTE52123.1 hypothetical protein ATE64_11985 [Sphingopyxis sp. H073]KTE60544.1 hypothetical protein ATE66_08160 [Sphingopyxis sp. H107]KTE63867.1 hypothetical protein ATE65_13775 [Sphingopyxis sp. H100]